MIMNTCTGALSTAMSVDEIDLLAQALEDGLQSLN